MDGDLSHPAPLEPPAPGVIHLWLLDTRHTDFETQRERWLAALSPQEVTTAQGLAQTAQARFIVGRCLLRYLLAGYGVGGELSYGANGKPYLDGLPLHFNVSHSGTLIACVFAEAVPLGVDIEQQRRVVYLPQLMAEHSAPHEFIAWQQLAPDEQQAAFFRLWTSKEAVLKACGVGLLQAPLSALPIPLERLRDDVTPLTTVYEGSRWWLYPFIPAPAYAGTIAAAIKSAQVVRREMVLRAVSATD